MTLPVMPPDRAVHQPSLTVDKERRRTFQGRSHPGAQPFDLLFFDPPLDSSAPVSVEPGTGAAVADLDPIDVVPLATAISRYGEDA